MDVYYAVTFLDRYASAPDRCHYLALKRLCNHLRRTIDWGIFYWRNDPTIFYLLAPSSFSLKKKQKRVFKGQEAEGP
jgi:hypothetical protein